MKLPRLPVGWSRPGQTRSRLLVLGVLAAMPIVLLAATIVWQDCQSVNKQSEQRAALVSGQVLAELRSQIATTASAALVDSTRMAASACRGSGPSPPIRLFLSGLDGHARCDLLDAYDLPRGQWFDRARVGAPFTLAFLAPNGPCVVAVTDGRGGVAAKVLPSTWLQTALSAGWGGQHGAAWLLDDERRVASSVGDEADALPTLPIMASLLTGPQVVRGRSASGRRYAYAASDIAGGWKLIVALDAAPEYRQAVRVFIVRSLELTVLLLAGLLGVVFAADVAFGAPLRRLSDSVQHWRAGEVFAPGTLAGAPDEVQQLARSFTEATTELRTKETQLQRAQEQQMLLVMEVHHRVKNNLQIVASLLNLQASRIRVPEARAEFQAARDRVRALATLHRHLYADGELHMINMRSFLVELCEQLFQALGETEGERIKLLIEAPELRLSSDEAVPMALIVTEIVTNSVKYAFPNGRAGTILVSLTQAEGELVLKISDDGVGIDAAVKIDPSGSRGGDRSGAGDRDGIGLRLIRGFSQQLGASLDVSHGNGTRYTMRLPQRQLSQRIRSDALDAALSRRESDA